MRSLIYLISLTLIASSCTGENDSNGADNDNPISDIDTMTIEEPEPIPLVLQTFPEELSNLSSSFDTLQFPFTLKHEVLDKHESKGEFSSKQLEFLSQNYTDKAVESYAYLNDALKMYERKQKGTYQTYVDNLDLAQLKDATAHPYGQLNLDTAIVLLWTVNYSSFEACPFYTGKDLYASVIQNDSVQTTVYLGNESSGGDPPMFAETFMNLEITKLLEMTRETTENVYEDETLYESDKSNYSSIINW
jgi:hypothetical protein